MFIIKGKGLIDLPGDGCRSIIWGKDHGNHRSRRNDRQGREEFRAHLAEIKELLSVERVAVMRPMHWKGIEEVSAGLDILSNLEFLPVACDGIFTTRSDVALFVASADCPVVIIYGPGILLMLHCGWRSLAHGIICEGISFLRSRKIAIPELRVFIAPGISSCCYEVGEDATDRLSQIMPLDRFCQRRSGRLYVSLQSFIHSHLRRQRIAEDRITIFQECTCCSSGFWSHRANNEERNAVIASLIPPA